MRGCYEHASFIVRTNSLGWLVLWQRLYHHVLSTDQMIRARHAIDAHARNFVPNNDLLPILKTFTQCIRSLTLLDLLDVFSLWIVVEQPAAPTNSQQSPAPRHPDPSAWITSWPVDCKRFSYLCPRFLLFHTNISYRKAWWWHG